MGAETVCDPTLPSRLREFKIDGGARQGKENRKDTSNKEVEGGSAIAATNQDNIWLVI